jgi:hypothetical protein
VKSAIFSVVVFIFLPVCLSAHLMIEPLEIILDLVFSYTNIWLKDSILYRIVVKVNMFLTKGFICTHSIFLYISKTLDNETYSFQINFLFFKLPAAFICGVRVKKLDEKECVATVSTVD